MKPETPTPRHWLTDADRDNILRLYECGLSAKEIAPIMKISKSAIQYIKQAHTACVEKDWSTLQRLSTYCRPTVDWAMKLTGTDEVFLKEFPKVDEPKQNETEPVVANDGPLHPLNAYEIYSVLTDIRSLLTEIRDILK